MTRQKPSFGAIARLSSVAVLAGALAWSAESTSADIGVEGTQFTGPPDAREARIDVYSADGALVFQSDAPTIQGLAWDGRDTHGQPVADGVYFATISMRTPTGEMSKRLEQITVSGTQAASSQTVSPQAVGPISGEGIGTATTGRIARFTGTNTIGSSVLRQGLGGRIGINVEPAAVLHINKGAPVSSSAAGSDARDLLQTTGGKGGSTTGSGMVAGKGANISLVAGNGGDAVAGSTNGNGGSITLQPGSPGGGGSGGAAGNVLLAPFLGNVGIGTADPVRALQIGPSFDAMFTIEPSDVSPRAGIIRFGDNTGWRLQFARSREFSAGPLNTGLTGNLLEIHDNGTFRLVGFPLGPTGVGPLCRTLSNVVTMCQSGSSSLRYKTDVEPYRKGLEVVDRLQPIAFTRTANGVRDIGLAAEDVEKVDPLLTYRNENGDIEGVKYELLGVAFVNAIKEQQAQLRRQQELIAELQARLERLERPE
jgi:hypothetical protein